jgi:hypothetical protein
MVERGIAMRLGWVVMGLAATPAGAACVDGMDLERGLLARFDGGLVLRLGLTEDGSVFVEDELGSPGESYRTVLRHGFWPVEAYGFRSDGGPDLETGIAWLYEDVEALPAPEEGLV